VGNKVVVVCAAVRKHKWSGVWAKKTETELLGLGFAHTVENVGGGGQFGGEVEEWCLQWDGGRGVVRS
jgi:hypothetical protein